MDRCVYLDETASTLLGGVRHGFSFLPSTVFDAYSTADAGPPHVVRDLRNRYIVLVAFCLGRFGIFFQFVLGLYRCRIVPVPPHRDAATTFVALCNSLRIFPSALASFWSRRFDDRKRVTVDLLVVEELAKSMVSPVKSFRSSVGTPNCRHDASYAPWICLRLAPVKPGDLTSLSVQIAASALLQSRAGRPLFHSIHFVDFPWQDTVQPNSTDALLDVFRNLSFVHNRAVAECQSKLKLEPLLRSPRGKVVFLDRVRRRELAS